MGSNVDAVRKDGRLFHTRAAATGNARSPTVDSHDGERQERVLTPSACAACTKVGDTPEVIGEVRWHTAMEAAVNENSELVLNPLLHLQPVQLMQKQRNSSVMCPNPQSLMDLHIFFSFKLQIVFISLYFVQTFVFSGHSYEGLRYEEGNCGVSVMRSGQFTFFIL